MQNAEQRTKEDMFIGLTGPIGAGKDTVADYLVSQFGFKKIAFADGLKEVCSALFGIPLERFYDRFQKERASRYWGMSPRQMAQQVGTEIIRNHFGTDHWVKLINLKISRAWIPGKPERWVFTDVRFQNEVDYICLTNNGILCRIDRPINPLQMLVKDKTHASEVQELKVSDPNKDCRIINASTKENLYVTTRTMLLLMYPSLFNPEEIEK